ncbi:hypothetical protein TAMA11512_22230 [Selenomonas sp. TAMA-11512]|uniref:O-linked N-acetylglucosamine transferase family protein n=1 Tax=Selenomonas sp. TAMA-11512 TaxID=3095337 RepID=UPI00308C83DE|nr:hypothetical protein TAMA11512_22230 [Selenomonas sp. TAMA-11512]
MDALGGWQLFLAAREEADAGQYRAALEKSARALEDASLFGADRAFIRNARGTMYRSLGEAEQATEEDYLAYRAATGDDKARMYGAYLFSRHYHETDSRALAKAIHAYGRLFRCVPCHAHDRDRHRAHEKIRVGYISPDFRKHIVASFMHPFFESYDRASFEVYGYALCEANPVMETFAAHADAFRVLTDLSPKEAARIIYADEIDILVDLSGHTAGGALPILARKPVPVQITGIGWFNTTGLAAVDYVLGDVHLDPEGEEAYFVEQILRLPHSHLCYAPAKACGVGTLPASRNGYVTFGSLNAFSKVTDEVLHTWAAILNEVPDAHLFLKADIFDSEDGCACVRERLRSAGIDIGRVMFEGRTEDYLKAYNAIDIALDTFPYPGGGTTCDALYMGVPVVTLAGDRHGSRFGKSLLENVRLPELVASSAAEYIEIAARLARDTARLKSLRQHLRQTMEAFHIMDAKLYMRDVEQAYREVFARWLDDEGEATLRRQGKDVFREGQAHERNEGSLYIDGSKGTDMTLKSEQAINIDQVIREAEELYERLSDWAEGGGELADVPELIERYASLGTDEAATHYFTAVLAHRLGEHELALREAQEAYVRRQLSSRIWKLLVVLYAKLGRRKEALFFQYLLARRRELDGPVRIGEEEEQEIWARAFSSVNAAPWYYLPLSEKADGSLDFELHVPLGEYLLGEHGPGAYWAGLYNDELYYHTIAMRIHALQEARSQPGGYDNIDFDVIRVQQETTDTEIVPPDNVPVIVPIAGDVVRSLRVSDGEKEAQINCGMSEWHFLRMERPTRIRSEQPFLVGAPIYLKHRTKRRLILNVLMDGLAWTSERAAGEYMPRTHAFFEKGIRFDNAYTVAEHTYPSEPMVETGLHMHRSQIFDNGFPVRLAKEYQTLPEKAKAQGYYTTAPMSDGYGLYNGSHRGFDRMICSPRLTQPAYIAVERAMEQLEALRETDVYMFLHVTDPHIMPRYQFPLRLSVQTGLPWYEQGVLDGRDNLASVNTVGDPAYLKDNAVGIRRMDRALGELYDFVQENYDEEEYVIHAYSDHGLRIYGGDDGWYFSEGQASVAMLMRGAGIPALGSTNELVSLLDMHAVVSRSLDADWRGTDANLPAALGGAEREYVISNSIFPGQTYKLDIRTREYECRFETETPTRLDGTVDMRDASEIIYRKGTRERVEDPALSAYFWSIAWEHVRSFHHEG